MFHKKWLSVLLMGALLSACGDKAAQTPAAEPTQNAAPVANPNLPTIQVGTDATYPPFQYRTEKGEVLGIEGDLLKAIGKTEGFNVNMEHSSRKLWHETLGKQHDVWASAFYDNAQYPAADVSKPFMQAYIVAAVCDDKDPNKTINSTASLQGKKIAVSQYYGQQMIDLAAKLTGSPSNVMVTDTFYLSARELYNKNVDAVLGANYVLAYYAHEMKNQDKTRYVQIDGEPPRNLVFLVKKGDTELLNKINTGIDKLHADGTIKALQEKWLPAWQPSATSASQ